MEEIISFQYEGFGDENSPL